MNKRVSPLVCSATRPGARAVNSSVCICNVADEAGIAQKMGRFEWKRKRVYRSKMAGFYEVFNALIISMKDQFCSVTLTDLVNMLNAVTGWDVTAKEALTIGNA